MNNDENKFSVGDYVQDKDGAIYKIVCTPDFTIYLTNHRNVYVVRSNGLYFVIDKAEFEARTEFARRPWTAK